VSREDVERFLTDSGRSAIDSLFKEAGQESDDFDVSEVLDRSLYEALTEYDHRAALNRWLSLRFTGAHTNGRLAEQAIVDVLGALQREIIGASPAKDPDLVKLDLVGFSRGSAILHLVPAATPDTDVSEDANEQTQGTLPVEPDRLDDALSVITELHSAAEHSGDVERFSGQEMLLRGFMALADALDKHDLDIGIVWRSRTGRHRSSELTSQGREYARQYLERSETAEILVISGRIVEMKISGTFDIKASLASNSPRYTITTGGEESLLGLSLQLGQSVRVRVRRHTEQNKVGVIFGSRYEYLGLMPSEDKLV
jgi:hypothetical protein